MSRHVFHMWNNFHVIGWDAGLNTFYLQLNAHREEPSPWLGTGQSEFPDPQPLVDRLRAHFKPEKGMTADDTADWDEIPANLYDTLVADRRAEPGWELPSEEVVQATLAALPPKRRTFWQKLVRR